MGPKRTAKTALTQNLTEARALLAELTAKLDAAEATENPHWGHVTLVADVAEYLRNALGRS